MKSVENTFTTQEWRSPAVSRGSIRTPFPRFWWQAMRPSAGGKRRTTQPTTRRCSKRSPAWRTTRLPCARVAPEFLRPCWTGTTSVNMAPKRPTDRRNNAPCSLVGFHPACPPELDRRSGDRDLLRDCGLHRLLPAWILQYQRRILYGRAGNDRLDRRFKLCFRQSRLARADGLGRLPLPVWNPGHALVLDRRHPGD